MKYTYDENTFSDLYKDAHGFRPRGHEFYDANTTPARKQEIWDGALADLDQEIEWQKQAEAEAVIKFEELIVTTIESGAGDRETALRWLAQAEGEGCHGEYDTSYFKFLHGLPYGYDLMQKEAA